MSTTIKEGSFCQRVVEAASVRPDKVAVTMLGPNGAESVTFGSMLAQIRSIAYRLSQEQVDFGDRVAIIGENHPNWAIAYLGILYRGAVVTPLDPAATIGALSSFLGDSEAKLAFVSPSSLEKFRAACEQLGRKIPAVALRPLAEPDGLGHFADWAQTPLPAERVAAPPPANPEDLALLIYTSGTTGVPKAVPLSHGNIYAESDKVQEVMHLSDQEVVLSLLPLFHAYSQIVNLWLATIAGARVVYLTELSTTEIERGLKEGQVTALVGVPRLWYLFHKKIFDGVQSKPKPIRLLFRALLWSNGWLRDVLGVNAGRLFFRPIHQSFGGGLRLAVSAGASFDAGVAVDFHRLGFTILQGYGLTETSGAATVTRYEDNKVGSVGTPLRGVDVKIDQPDVAGVGEVLIRGPVVMAGYYRMPEANREAFTDGWFRSGDLGRFDKQGHLFIVGRKKDVIKLPSGKNVFPEDVEAHYERSPFVSEVCVLGLRDDTSQFKGAEKLCAVVVPNFDHLKAQSVGNAREWVVWELENLGRELPEHQRVHDFVLRAEPLPRTSTRKLRRFELKDQLESAHKIAGARRVNDAVLSVADLALMDSPAGFAIIAAIKQHALDVRQIHPQMNLEIDLGLDSLARAECVASTEESLGIELAPEQLPAVQTVADLLRLASAKLTGSQGKVCPSSARAGFHWRDVVTATPADSPELAPLLKEKPALVLLAFVALKIANVAARLLFRMKVKGLENLTQLKPPYLICPNHQSFIDPVLVASSYPRAVLERTFHVGASMYFTNPLTARIARMINVVPIDPDLQLLRAMRAGAIGLRAGKILNIYPEGQRSFDGRLLDFKKGAAILATELAIPIVPVAIDGAHLIWPRGSWRLRLHQVKLAFGDPIYPGAVVTGAAEAETAYEKLSALLRARIQEMLAEMRAAQD